MSMTGGRRYSLDVIPVRRYPHQKKLEFDDS